ncbi:multiple inositol polyphosphate phosphatase 1-like isoform X2 [Vespa crabro]|uniref:multiple inositol polyphosphate phosphatase 1-like isoform X2 n=1 Tax=Vespa crabro TaxID=7445 RepID=UPI001EFFA9E4|nr:multiple inositol polyphosphate phosphatase 1-like isoform X2 [Vespa crabro]
MILDLRIVFIFLITNIVCFAYDCFLQNDNYRCRLGSKTPYRFIGYQHDTPIEYSGCKPKKIWLILRHGTRYPGKKNVPHMIKNLPELQKIILNNYKMNKTNLSHDTIIKLSNWKLRFTKNDMMNLAKEGENEMIDLGERYQSRFPNIMPEIYNKRSYKLKYTATQRTEESAKHFAVGLFGWQNSQNVEYPKPKHKDPILRFYKRCTRWSNEVSKNKSAHIEKERFLKSELLTTTVKSVSKRIGHQINYDTLDLIYAMCAFETAWYKDEDSPWCELLSLDDFKVLEFANDIEYYWIDGYGYKITYEQACVVLLDIFKFFSEDNETLASIYFTHSGTILKFLARLGVARDKIPLTHDSFRLHVDNRAWRTTYIDAFASNIAFVLYDCESQGPSILFMHQERVVYLPNCPKNMPCPLSTMKDLYPSNEEDCQFDVMCNLYENDMSYIDEDDV